MLSRPELIRQFDLVPNGVLKTPVTVIGAGAIGSSVTLWLAKLGMENISVWDPDQVSIENLSCQLYGPEDIGKPKVEALSSIVTKLSTGKITPHAARWEATSATKGIVVMAADCMEVRAKSFEAIRQNCFQVSHFIDCRMGAEMALMYCMEPFSQKDCASYRKTLYTNENAVQAPCTAKATGYTGSLLSAWAVKAVKDIITGGNYPRVTQWSVKDSQMIVFRKDKDA